MAAGFRTLALACVLAGIAGGAGQADDAIPCDLARAGEPSAAIDVCSSLIGAAEAAASPDAAALSGLYNNRGLARLIIARRTFGAYDAAIADFDRALELDPQNAMAAFNRGHAHALAGALARAAEDFANAIALRPDFAPARMALAEALEVGGRRDEARQAYRDLLGWLPADAPDRARAEARLRALGAR